LARELAHKVYGVTKKVKFARNFGLKRQIQGAAGNPEPVNGPLIPQIFKSSGLVKAFALC
jgi:hypothetical protein